MPAAEALIAGTNALAFFAVRQPLAGMLSDRIGRKPLLIVLALFGLVVSLRLPETAHRPLD